MRRVTIAAAVVSCAALFSAPPALATLPQSGPTPADCVVLLQPLQIDGIPGSGPHLGLPHAPITPVTPVGAQC